MSRIAWISLAIGLLISHSVFSMSRSEDVQTKIPVDVFTGSKTFGGSFGLGGTYDGGNVRSDQTIANLNAYYNRGQFTLSADGHLFYWELGDTANKFLNKGHFNLRADYHFNDHWGLLAINTHGYHENQQLIYRRGTGLGAKWFTIKKKYVLDLSLLIGHEDEKFLGPVNDNATRMSFRTFFKYNFTKDKNIKVDLYYVPNLDDFNDVRMIGNFSFNTALYKDIVWLSLAHSRERDKRPRPGVEEEDRNTNFSFSFKW